MNSTQGPTTFRMGEMGAELLLAILDEIEREMKNLGIWSAQRDNSHPQISSPSDWLQWDYLRSLRNSLGQAELSELFGSQSLEKIVGSHFAEPKFEPLRGLLQKWDESYAEFAAPLLAKQPKLFERTVLAWIVPISQVNEAFERKFEEIRSKLKMPGFRLGGAPIEAIRQKYEIRVRDEIIFSLAQAQAKIALAEKGYSFEEGHPTCKYDPENLKLGCPFPIHIELSVPLIRTKN